MSDPLLATLPLDELRTLNNEVVRLRADLAQAITYLDLLCDADCQCSRRAFIARVLHAGDTDRANHLAMRLPSEFADALDRVCTCHADAANKVIGNHFDDCALR